MVSKDSQKLAEFASFNESCQKVNDDKTFYICENYVCYKPITDTEMAINLLTR
ncbi:hypothetical protein JFU50_24150 [Peribacillus sp. TH14]|nr:hypothetical protein [Peribacillus sp. TH14]